MLVQFRCKLSFVAGYAARKLVGQRNKCSDCKELAVSDDDIAEMENENNYLRKLS